MGALLILVTALLLSLIGSRVIGRQIQVLDDAEKFGLGGALLLAAIGLFTLLLGLWPGFALGGSVIGIAIVVLVWKADILRITRPKLYASALPIVALFLIPLISVLAPSDTRDWDSLAYHLAVPKLWLEQGQVGFVQGIHHSNFPFTADMLYVWGLQWGGQAGAKAFNLCWLILGCFALYGITHRWYPENKNAPWFAALAFAGCPVVLWEAGTGYIDIPHGLFCGLATLYLADALKSGDKKFWWLAGICLGFAMGTKHTGLQTFGAIVLVGTIVALIRQKNVAREDAHPPALKGLMLTAGLALLIASPWYIKSVAYTGNPVYPFFYKQLGGKYWDQWRSDIYTIEQKSFGVGSNPAQLSHAVLGLSYQPGRYVNPRQDEGRGFPTGAIGFAALLAGALWAASGKIGPREKIVLGVVGIALLAWFVLSQQSRYLTSIVVPLAVLVGGGVANLRLGKVIAGATVLQAAYTAVMLWTTQTQTQLLAVTGEVSREEYQRATVAFYEPAQVINQLPGTVKVALFDEVFGYFLDKPYMWANPGHSTLLYENVTDSQSFQARLKELGFTHLYVNLQFMEPRVRSLFVQACVATPDPSWQSQASDPQTAWRLYVTEIAKRAPAKTWMPNEQAPRSLLIELPR